MTVASTIKQQTQVRLESAKIVNYDRKLLSKS